MSKLRDRLWEPCPVCNEDAEFAPMPWVCGACDGRRFVATIVTRADLAEAETIVEKLVEMVSDAEDLVSSLRSFHPIRRQGRTSLVG